MEISALGAFLAGLLSFLSPCILPVIPAYLSYISGVGLADGKSEGFNLKVFLSSLFFVLGFSVVFVLMGASASFLGGLLKSYQPLILKVGSGLVVFFGLHFSGVFFWRHFLKAYLAVGLLIPLLYALGYLRREEAEGLATAYFLVLALYLFRVHELLYRQMKIEAKASASYLGAFLVGMVFALGWSPCIGPVLASILLVASQQETLWKGALLLAFYSAGMGLPFLLAGLAFSAFVRFVSRFSRFFKWVEVAGGVLLVSLGLLLATGKLYLLTGWVAG